MVCVFLGLWCSVVCFLLATLFLKSYSFLGLIGSFNRMKRFACVSEFFSLGRDTVRIVTFIKTLLVACTYFPEMPAVALALQWMPDS